MNKFEKFVGVVAGLFGYDTRFARKYSPGKPRGIVWEFYEKEKSKSSS